MTDTTRHYRQRRRYFIILLILLALMALMALFVALWVGSVPIAPGVAWALLTGSGGDGLDAEIVLRLRLPRALTAFATGGLLALSGALLQVLLRNPLAEPYLLGVSGGAAVGALSVLMAGLGGGWLRGAACYGALVSTVLVLGLSRGGPGAWHTTRVLLTGVVVAAGWGAVVSLLLAISPEAGLRGMLFWLMGDLGQSQAPEIALATLALGLVIALALAPYLNIIARGELTAAALGVAVDEIRLAVYLLSSVLTAVAVTEGGSIGFVGLIVPHIIRVIVGVDHRLLLPATVLLGGVLLLITDTVARTIAAPRELPVGVVTALIGVPVFLVLLHVNSYSSTNVRKNNHVRANHCTRHGSCLPTFRDS
ncbi:iron complex transport system permease protein [Gammaproteobacteria bacterium]